MNQTTSDAILYQARLHWIIFVLPLFLIILGGYVEYLWGRSFGMPFLLMGGGWGCYSILLYVSSSLQITKNFITVQTGILVRKTLNVSRTQLESIDVNQSILGTICNYGSFSVQGTGGTQAFFSPMASPLTCRRFIETNI